MHCVLSKLIVKVMLMKPLQLYQIRKAEVLILALLIKQDHVLSLTINPNTFCVTHTHDYGLINTNVQLLTPPFDIFKITHPSMVVRNQRCQKKKNHISYYYAILVLLVVVLLISAPQQPASLPHQSSSRMKRYRGRKRLSIWEVYASNMATSVMELTIHE